MHAATILSRRLWWEGFEEEEKKKKKLTNFIFHTNFITSIIACVKSTTSIFMLCELKKIADEFLRKGFH